MNIARLWSIAARRWLLLLVLFSVTFAPMGFLTRPPRVVAHVATSSVLIAPDPRVLERPDPLVPSVQYWSFDDKVDSLRERPVLRRAVALMRGDRAFESVVFREGDWPERIAAVQEHYGRVNEGRSDAELVRELEENLATKHEDRAQLVRVATRHEHPSLALLTSWAVLEAARQRHSERVFEPMVQYAEAVELQLERIDEELAAARDALAAEENRHPLDFQERWVSVRTLRSEFQQEYDATHGAYESGRVDAARARAILRSRASFRDRQKVDWLTDQWILAQTHLERLSTEYSEHHPEVRAASARFDQITEEIEALPEASESRVRERAAADETIRQHEALVARRAVLETRLAELDAEAAELGAMRASVRPFAREVQRLEITRARYERLDSRLGNARLWKAGPVVPFDVADSTFPLDAPPIPSRWWWSAIVGAVVAFFGAVVRERTDRRVRDTTRLVEKTGLEPSVVLPELIDDSEGESDAARRWPLVAEFDLTRELHQHTYPLETEIVDRQRRGALTTVAVTSPGPRDGRSTVAATLAEGLARRGLRVAWVDADFRAGFLAEDSAPSDETKEWHPGLAELLCLVDETALEERRRRGEASSFGGVPEPPVPSKLGVVRPRTLHDVTVATRVVGLHRIGCGRLDALGPNASITYRLRRANVDACVALIAREFDLVILDLPPVGIFGDALPFLEAADGAVLVVGAEGDYRATVRAKRTIDDLGTPLVGTVLNRADCGPLPQRPDTEPTPAEWAASGVHGPTLPEAVARPEPARPVEVLTS